MNNDRQRQENGGSHQNEYIRIQILELIYRAIVIIVGFMFTYLGYLFFIATTSASDKKSMDVLALSLGEKLPGAFFCFLGIIFCLVGLFRLMPLPRSIPVLLNDSASTVVEPADLKENFESPVDPQDNLWVKNIKPIIKKVSTNDDVTRSDRELLRKWIDSF